MNDVPQVKLYKSPQERYFSIGSTPDVFPGDDPRELFTISPLSDFQLPGSHRSDLSTLIQQQNELRERTGIELLWMYDHPQARTELGLTQNEKVGMTLVPLITEGPNMGMTRDNPGFKAVTVDEETGQPVKDRDITDTFYQRYEKHDPPLPTYREERRSITSPEGNETGGPENRG